MSPSSSRRHRLRVSLATAVVGVALLAGCAGQKAPDNYSDSVEKNFLDGCTTTAKQDGAEFVIDEYCTCMYDTLSGDGELAVDFKVFKKVNEDQIEEPSPLPESFTNVTEDCLGKQGESAAGETSTTSGSGDEDTTSTTEG